MHNTYFSLKIETGMYCLQLLCLWQTTEILAKLKLGAGHSVPRLPSCRNEENLPLPLQNEEDYSSLKLSLQNDTRVKDRIVSFQYYI